VSPAFTFIPADEEEVKDEDDLIVIPHVAPDAAGNNGLNKNMLEEDSEMSDPPGDLEWSIDNVDLSFLYHRAGAERKSRGRDEGLSFLGGFPAGSSRKRRRLSDGRHSSTRSDCCFAVVLVICYYFDSFSWRACRICVRCFVFEYLGHNV
jgi:hypothetical protein